MKILKTLTQKHYEGTIIHFHVIKQSKFLLCQSCQICILPWQSWEFCYIISQSYNRFHKFGADEKCVSRLHSMEAWESGQPVTRATKQSTGKSWFLMVALPPLNSASISNRRDLFFCFQQQICENNAGRIWIRSIEFFEVFAKFSLFQKDAVSGWVLLIWLP